MAKIYGLFGSMTGKVADVVMSIRNGEQIVRKYQPVVQNPSTEAQVAARARLKLMSQLSAVMAPVIAMPKDGVVSSRNQFVKKNYGLSSYATNQAEITLANVQLTSSVVSMPRLNAQREEAAIAVACNPQDFFDVSRVVYAAFAKDSDGTLRYIGSRVITEAGAMNRYSASFPLISEEVVILAYGVRDNTEAAKATFGELRALTAETIAKIIVSRMLLESDVTMTETRGINVAIA